MPVAALRRFALPLLLAAAGAVAAPASYSVLSDALDADAPVATLPAGPVEQALAELAREQPQARVLVPLRRGERAGQRHALAAWQSTPGAKDWDAMLVVATAAGARQIEITSTSKDREAVLDALIALGSSGVAPAVAPHPAAAPAPLPSARDQRFVVLYSRNPAYRPADAASEAALTDRHIQYTLALQADGTALAAGPFGAEGASAAPQGGAGAAIAAAEAPIGMTLLRVRDLAAAERIAAADPAVAAGRLLATVRAWQLPAGRLP